LLPTGQNGVFSVPTRRYTDVAVVGADVFRLLAHVINNARRGMGLLNALHVRSFAVTATLGAAIVFYPHERCVAAASTPAGGSWGPTALLYAPTQPNNASFCAAVAALLQSPVHYMDVRTHTPALAELEPYAAVFTWTNYAYDDREAMGDVLADYVDGGGRVLLGQWTFHCTPTNWLGGRIMTADYCPAICSSVAVNWTYAGDGQSCLHHSPLGDVAGYSAMYADVISGLQSGAVSDGHWTSDSPSVAYWPDMRVIYSSGHTGMDFSSGDWALLTANMVACGRPAGACCDITSGECLDDMQAEQCLGLGPAWRPHAGQQCALLDPPCGDPGCCCDSPEWGEPAEPRFAYRANCSGRFVSEVPGEDCIGAAFEPECGLWQPSGVLYAPSYPDNATFRAAVAALLGGPVDYFDTRGTTPTLDEMLDYHCVMTWCNYSYADRIAFGDRLADYVDAGGCVILGQWAYPGLAGWTPGEFHGRILDPEYCPVTVADYVSTGASYAGDGQDCLHLGADEYASTYVDIAALMPGAQSDGTFSTGDPAVAWRPDRRVYYSPGNTGGSYGTGDWARLTANMCTCQVPHTIGDLNCDGVINGYDIDPFVLALTGPAEYAAQFADCDYMLADCNGDGYVNGYDIDPFVQLLTDLLS
jgi:hypothetical protein